MLQHGPLDEEMWVVNFRLADQQWRELWELSIRPAVPSQL